MTVEFGDRDIELMRGALTRHLSVLREELVHTDDRAYRRELRDNLTKLEDLLGRLSAEKSARSTETHIGGP